MDKPVTLGILSTQDIGRRQAKQKHNTESSKDEQHEPTKNHNTENNKDEQHGSTKNTTQKTKQMGNTVPTINRRGETRVLA